MANYKHYGLLGYNISYSLSPYIFNSVFQNNNLSSKYDLYDIKPDELKNFISTLKTSSIAGLNVTIPHKETVIQYLDKLDPVASSIGAVNLVVNSDGLLCGYNTDLYGIKETIESFMNISLRSKRVFLIGAGGSARAVLEYLCQARPMKVNIFNRSIKQIKHMVDCKVMPFELDILSLSNLKNTLYDSPPALIINATPIAITNIATEIPSSVRVFELSYSRDQNNDNHCSHICDGKYMLAAQASASMMIMCGISETTENIIKLLRN